jgi:DNA-directed RNA polymerase subunit omega
MSKPAANPGKTKSFPVDFPTPQLALPERLMARITVEDCLPNVENIFQLVLLAAQRARRLANGAEPTVPWENDKPTVVALREIAEGNITPEMLREPDPPPPEATLPDADNQSLFRAPQFGLQGDRDVQE